MSNFFQNIIDILKKIVKNNLNEIIIQYYFNIKLLYIFVFLPILKYNFN